MSGWQAIEVYGTFVKVTGELELLGIERLSDSINRYGSYITLRDCRVEPLGLNHPVLSRREPSMTLAKQGALLICPLDGTSEGNSAMWQETEPHPAAITTSVFSLEGDVHLAPGQSLQDHLERHPGDFLPVTNLSALWITTLAEETTSVLRPFGLVNPVSILSFAVR